MRAVSDKEGSGHVMEAGARCKGAIFCPLGQEDARGGRVRGGGIAFLGKGRVAPPPGNLPTVGYNLTALSQDSCSA